MGDRPAIPVATRLRSAIVANDLLLVKRILRNNPTYLKNPNLDDDGNTSLHLAAILGHLEIIRYLVDSGHEASTPQDICSGRAEEDDEEGSTTTSSSYVEISLNGNLSTPLHLAATHSHPSCVRYLCETFPQTVDKRDYEGATPLMCAVPSANARTYVPHSTNLLPPRQLPTPRYVPGGHGANAGVSALAAAATAAAAAASAAAEDTGTISVLLQYGADVNAVDYQGNSPLHRACAWGNLKSFRLLLGAGAKTNATNCQGFVPLDYAVSMSTFKYCRSLIMEFELQKQRLHQPITVPVPSISNVATPVSSNQIQSRSQSRTQTQTHNQNQTRNQTQNYNQNQVLRPNQNQDQVQRLPLPMTPTLPSLHIKHERLTPKLRLQTSTTDLTLGSAPNTPLPGTSDTRTLSSPHPTMSRGAMSATSVRPLSPSETRSTCTNPASAVI
ncbi:hypothetical protein KEM54_006273 [Ascosphaera aggregata]|nr:hypothetical protein KEM54_006273 [Ascosphaera aggregata]